MRKSLSVLFIIFIYSVIVLDILLLQNNIPFIRPVILLVFAFSSWKLHIFKNVYFLSAMVFLCFSVVLFYISSYPYFKESANWTFYFIIFGTIQLALKNKTS